jgi:hypothetical protein
MKKNFLPVIAFVAIFSSVQLFAQNQTLPPCQSGNMLPNNPPTYTGKNIAITNIQMTTSGSTTTLTFNVRWVRISTSGGNRAVNGNKVTAALFCNGNIATTIIQKIGGTATACSGSVDNFGAEGTFIPCTAIFTNFQNACPTTPPNPTKEVGFVFYSSSGGNNCSAGQEPCTPAQIPLPVTLKSFNASRNNAAVSLSWTTATERNNSGFAVERNTQGTWQQIGWVPSQAQDGNSDAVLSYTYTDLNSTKGVSQYRIRQVDHDSKASYSEVRSVRGESQPGKTLVYPNPSQNGKVSLLFEDGSIKRDVSVTDMSGRIVRQMKSVSTNNVTLENLQPGMYIVRIVDVESGEQSVEKFMVSKR